MAVVIQPRRLNVRKTIFVASVLIAFFVYTYFIRDAPGPANPVFRGATMGTTYEVKIVASPLSQDDLVALRREIDDRLVDLNRQMSTYDEDSEISRFNASSNTALFAVSSDFAEVAAFAVSLSVTTGGAFDPTLDPLINLWGFGHEDRRESPPSEEEVAAALAQCGAAHLTALPEHRLQKGIPDLRLNLNAVAKGYAVDEVSRILEEQGLTNTYVEIGGEVVVRGVNFESGPWRIGIDLPQPGAVPGERFALITALTDRAMATSGDYRNYYVDSDGTRRTHLIDPRTGRPIGHALASVSVIGPSCMAADGVATALMILGAEEGLRWIETQTDLEALFLVRTNDGTFQESRSSGFGDYVQP